MELENHKRKIKNAIDNAEELAQALKDWLQGVLTDKEYEERRVISAENATQNTQKR